jgi:hypothetical protein
MSEAMTYLKLTSDEERAHFLQLFSPIEDPIIDMPWTTNEDAFYESKKSAAPINDTRYRELLNQIDQLPIEQRVDLYYRLGVEIEATGYVDNVSFRARDAALIAERRAMSA